MKKKIWDLYAPVYELAMRSDRKIYQYMYDRIPEVIRDKAVLEIGTGPGLIAKHVAFAAKSMTATDYSEGMIREAEKGVYPSCLKFEVADGMALPYPDCSFDAVIIANALHIMPDPERALREIDRVLRADGILIAPNFVEHRGGAVSRLWSGILKIAGIKFEHQWTGEEYLQWLEENGWEVTFEKALDARIAMMYTECRRKEGAGDNAGDITEEPEHGLKEDGKMKPDYKNWMPKGMIASFAAGSAVSLGAALRLYLLSGHCPETKVKRLPAAFAGGIGVIFSALTAWGIFMYRAFDYNGKRRMAKQIIDGTADQISLPEGGRCLDVGCGSGALAIAVAKRNPQAEVTGIDRWGMEYASFSKKLCEQNAAAEGVENVRFQKGNAVQLDFPDESFDAVVSNYVYHNIPVRDRQELLEETLRTLKKGGSFAIHDIFSASKYGDMQAFVKKLQDMGYEEVKLTDTTKGKFMSARVAFCLGLSGSALLTGKK